MNRFPGILHNEILKGLPGTDVQWEMASSGRIIRNFPRTAGEHAKEAAVLISLYPRNNSVFTLFMQRPDYDGVHSGQISFPGGKQEDSDRDHIHTAVREAEEEAGIDPRNVKIIGTLTPLFIPVSNTVVTPVVAWLKKRPQLNHKSGEVVFLFEADIRRFYDPAMTKTRPMEINNTTIEVKYFDYEGNMIWGATAMIFWELLIIIRKAGLLPPE